MNTGTTKRCCYNVYKINSSIKLQCHSGLGISLNAVGTIAINLGGMVTCETVLTCICDDGNMKIWLMCNGNGAGSDFTMDLGPWCRSYCFKENQSIPIR